jgi:hypothetical protein
MKMNFKIFLIFVFVLFIFPLTTYASKSSITLTDRVLNTNNTVSNTFTYSITPDQSNKSGATNEPTQIEVTLNKVKGNNGVVSYDYEIDFSSVHYTQYGIYKYLIEEISSSDMENYSLSNDKYYIYVLYSNQGIASVYGQAYNVTDNSKSDLIFNHNHNYTNIKITNTTTGKLFNTNEYFKFKLVINGQVGDRYYIDGQDSIIKFNGNNINTTNYYTVKNSDNYVYIYLKKDQTITIGTEDGINQIPIGTHYSLQKIGSRSWETTYEVINNYTTSDNEDVNYIIIINRRDYDVAITGVFLDILPFVILIALGILGLILIRKIGKKND